MLLLSLHKRDFNLSSNYWNFDIVLCNVCCRIFIKAFSFLEQHQVEISESFVDGFVKVVLLSLFCGIISFVCVGFI